MDNRIFFKECCSLSDAGYNVTLIAPHNRTEVIDGISIRGIKKQRNRFFRMTLCSVFAFRSAVNGDYEICHFHDPELIPVVLLLKFYRKKVIYDVHENVSQQHLARKWLGPKAMRWFLYFVTHFVEQCAVRWFDAIIAATPDISRKFPSHKTILVRNFPVLSTIDAAVPALAENPDRKFRIIYAGALTPVRGVRQIVEAMEYMDSSTELLLLGKWGDNHFQKECESLPGWKKVLYLGFRSPSEVYGFMKSADVGVVPLKGAINYLTSLPVKAFEYMACGIPVLMSDFPYWKKIYDGCACFVNSEIPADLAEKINMLKERPELRRTLGNAGRKMVEERYCWEYESRNLLNLYEKLFG